MPNIIDNPTGLFKVTQNIFLLNNKKQFVILKHKSGPWLLPGGRLAQGESPEQGLRREIEEELSIKDFNIQKVLKMDTWIDKTILYLGILYLGTLSSDKIVLSEEHTDYKWIGTLSDLKGINFWNDSLSNKVIEFLQSINERE